MKHLPIRAALLLLCLVFLTAALFLGLRGKISELGATAAPPATTAELTRQLAESEALLKSRRASLSQALEAYYRGEAREADTTRLIAEVEELRQRVEALRLETQNADADK